VSYLFDFLKKKRTPVTVEMYAYENGRKVPIKDTGKAATGKLFPMEYYETIEREIKPLEDRMVKYAVKSRECKKVAERKAALEGVITTFYLLKSKCANLGPEYEKYFYEMWEYVNSSKGKNKSYIKNFENELSELDANYLELHERELLHDRESANLEARVLKVLRENPQILQTDVYKHFNKIVQQDVQSILYFMERNKRIKREKSGRTYMIHFIK